MGAILPENWTLLIKLLSSI